MEKDSEKAMRTAKREKSDAYRQTITWGFIIVGIMILAVGIWYWFHYVPPYVEITDSGEVIIQGSDSDPSGIMIGTGAGLIIWGAIFFSRSRRLRKNPQHARDMEVMQIDERNLLIENKARAKAFEISAISVMAILLFCVVLSPFYTGEHWLFFYMDGVILCILFVMMISYFLFYRKYTKEM